MTLTQHLTFKNILIAGLAIAIIVLLMDCRGRNRAMERVQAAQIKSEELRKKDSADFIAKERRWQDSIHNAGINSDLQVKVIKETEKKLQASQTAVNRLTAIIRSEPDKPDTLKGVLVSADYKEACDSLPDKIDSQNAVIADLKQDNEGLIDLMNYEVVYRDSLIEVEQQQVSQLNLTIAGKNKIIEDAIKAGRPRGRFLVGAGNLFLPDRIFNPHFAAAYQAKNGKQFQGKVGLVNAQQYYEGSVLFTIFK